MKKRNIVILAAALLLSGCQNEHTPTSSSSSFTPIVIENVSQAINNTQYYGFRNIHNEYNYHEVYIENYYINAFAGQGYIVLENDPNYLHELKIFSSEIDGNIDQDIEIYGRVTTANNFSVLKQSNIMSFLSIYAYSFSKIDDNVFQSKDANLCSDFSDFMMANYLKYANCIELTTNENGRIAEITVYEIYEDQKMLIFNGVFDELTLNDVGPYQRWKENGSIINERIIDYKNLIPVLSSYTSVYENEKVEFDATVIAYDSDDNLYVANKNSYTGNVGIKVLDLDQKYDIGTQLHIEGTIKTYDFIATVIDATITNLGTKANYIPTFDEEMVVDSYGGGNYAARFFSGNPMYSDSLYSTYGYIEELPPLKASQDTIITISCPTQTNDNGQYFKMDLVIPYNLDQELKNEIYANLQTVTLYPNEGATELRIEKFIMRYNMLRSNNVELIAVSNSSVEKRKTSSEIILEEFNLSSFPLIEGVSTRAFHYGEVNDLYLESQYGISDSFTNGYYIEQSSVTKEQFDLFIQSLLNLGYVEQNQILDLYDGRHYLFDYGDVHLDVSASITSDDSYQLMIFIYRGERIKSASIYEQTKNVLGDWFTEDYFVALEGTYDADYTVFSVYNYAGKDYSNNPLTIVTYDSHEDIFDDYARALIAQGYKQYRVDNRPYSYKCRGQIHYVFQKDNLMVDIASYHTSDYTYTGHDEFTYRLEIVYYIGDAPLEVANYSSVAPLVNLYSTVDPSLEYNVELPSDAVVELWKYHYVSGMVTYGYGMCDEAFIYTASIDETYNAIKDALVEAGYSLSFEKDNSALYFKYIDGQSYPVFILKESDKGYVRLMHSVGGVSFYR